ncbi:MAG TPA: transglutaminase-like domain-containing protein [Gaiellaceae bacterium]|nr:transglutaminase-like domain-containing protein [Gaiellaceae bacterium]
MIAAAWLRLEQPRDGLSRAVVGVGLAFGFWLHPLRAAARLGHGVRDFYDVSTPFDPRLHSDMRAAILVAIFAFVVALVIAVAARRSVTAVSVVLVGAGWPATLVGDTHALAQGAAILAAILALLSIRWRSLPVAAVLVLAGVAASTSGAVSKGELVNWQGWDFYNAPTPPVSVAYVWNAQYEGITFPRTRTTVLEVKAPRTPVFWRATVLDTFAGDRWLEGNVAEPASPRTTPRIRESVADKALVSDHLVAGGIPLKFSTRAHVLAPGSTYSVTSYVAQPTAQQLTVSSTRYPSALAPFLDVWPGVRMPPFRSSVKRVTAVLDAHPEIERYLPIQHAAVAVAGRASTPYAAAVALDAWFRSTGGFRYTNHPAVFGAAPLVGFVAETRAGYCQYFAGAMALMLRYLGVPARVAVGFSSGTYDAGRGIWTVTDHDAHAWVEAWFDGYGWLPFDPTPAGRPERGDLPTSFAAAVTAGPTSKQGAHRHGEAGGVPTVGAAPAATASPSRTDNLFELLALLVAGALAAIVVLKFLVRRARFVSRDPRRLAAACRRELADYLLDQRIEAARSATMHELGALVRDELLVDPDRFVAAATAARFGPPAGARDASRDARRELRSLVQRMRKRLTARERVRGLLSLRSAGFAP